MKKLFYITVGLCFVFLPSIASARVDITSDITESTTWTRDAGPYVIDGEILIPNGVTVNVEPGTVIKYTLYSKLTINGVLNLNGSDSESIVVTSNRDDEYGGDTNADEELDYEESPAVADFEAYTVTSGGSLKVGHTLFRYTGTVMANEGGSVNISSVSFDNVDSVLWQWLGSTSIHDTVFDTKPLTLTSGNVSLDQVSFINQTLYLAGTVSAEINNSVFNSTTRTFSGINMNDSASLDIASTTIDGFRTGINAFGANRITADFVHINNNYVGVSYDTVHIIGRSFLMKFAQFLIPVVHAEDGSFADISNSSITNNRDYAVFNNIDGFTVLAKGNWWGDASGPTIYDGVGDLSNYVSGIVDTSDFLLAPPTAPKPKTPKCCSSVMFLPGIMGSRLYKPRTIIGEDQLWEPNNDEDVTDLFLDGNGKGIGDDIYTRDVIDEKNVLPIFQGNVYKSFLSDLKKWKTDDGIIADYEAIPYDWRLSLEDILNNGHKVGDKIYYAGANAATTSPYIIQELRRLAENSKTKKVTIVAHSNGGLLTKALTDKLGPEASTLIDKIIFVAVPQLGTPQAVGALLHGYGMGLPSDNMPLVLHPETARQFASTSQMAYNLLPSATYFNSVTDPVATFDGSALLAPWRSTYGSAISSPYVLAAFVRNDAQFSPRSSDSLKVPIVGKASLLANAANVHEHLDAWQPPLGVLLVQIAGWGMPTAETIKYYAGVDTECSNKNVPPNDCVLTKTSSSVDYWVKETADGDGTVVVPSALWTASSTRYWVNLFKYDSFFTIQRKHADVLEVPSLRTFVKNLITGSSTAELPEFISTSTPSTQVNLPRLRFTLHSPLYIGVFDSLGNFTGISTTTGAVVEDIPDSYFRQYGELTYVDVPASTTASAILTGYATSTFTLDVQTLWGVDVATTTTFAGVPATPASIVTARVSSEGDTSDLKIDSNGDGVNDFSVPATVGAVNVYTPTQKNNAVEPTLNGTQQPLHSASSKNRSSGNQLAFSLTDKGFVPVSFNASVNAHEILTSVYNGWTILISIGQSGEVLFIIRKLN